MTAFRFEGLTLTVDDVARSVAFYQGKLGLAVGVNAAPALAMIRCGAKGGGTIGLLSFANGVTTVGCVVAEAIKAGGAAMSPAQKLGIHVEFSTDDLDALYAELKAKGVQFHESPHDEPWERSMTALDPDGYAVEFAQGRRGSNATGGKP